MTAPTRVCPKCGHSGPLAAFPLVPGGLTPPQHIRDRQCPRCGHQGRLWVFRQPTRQEARA